MSNLIVLLVIAGGLAVWLGVWRRLTKGETVVPWEPRRPVPWQGGHVLVLALLFLGLQISVPAFVRGSSAPRAEAAAHDHGKTDTEHPIGRLLRDSQSPGVFLLCLAAAVMVAPLTEEFLFRLVIQGWLEKRDRLFRRAGGGRWPGMPGAIPVVVVALLFAGIHFRTATPQIDVSIGIRILLGVALANLLTLIVGVAWLRLDAGATAADLGLVPAKLAADVRTGLLGYLAIATIMFPLNAGLSWILPPNIAPDPFSLFPLALMLGFLYYRTHRLAPSIVVHMGLNLTSLLGEWLRATMSS
jgi:membrane protease YdiL (CAAX protease family)